MDINNRARHWSRSSVSRSILRFVALVLLTVFVLSGRPAAAADPGGAAERVHTTPTERFSAVRLQGGWLRVRHRAATESYVYRTDAPLSYSALHPVLYAPNVTATKRDILPVGMTEVLPGGVITYEVVIGNTGSSDATGLAFEDTIDPNTTLAPGSVKTTPLAVNDGPYDVIGHVAISVSAPGVLANDFDDGALTIVAFDAASAAGGAVAVNPDGSFTYDPPVGFEGTDTFTYTVEDADANTDVATVTLSVDEVVWFIDASQGTSGDGRFLSPFNSVADYNAQQGGAAAPDDPESGDYVFLYAGTYDGGVTLLDDQKLIGQGVNLVVNSVVLVTASSPPTLHNTTAANGGHGVALAQNNDVHGLVVGNTPGGTGLQGASVGTLTVSAVAVEGTGSVLDLAGGTLNAAFDALSTTSGAFGVRLAGLAGSLSAASGTSLSGLGGPGIDVQNAPGSFSFGALDVSTANQTGVFAINVGVLASTSGTLTTGTASALDIDDTGLSLALTSVSSQNGAAPGIDLSNTTGSLVVSGDGTGSQNGSGGTISGKTGHGISLDDVTNVSLSSMNVQDNAGNGIDGFDVNGFDAAGLAVLRNGDAVGESGLRFGDGVRNGVVGNASLIDTHVGRSGEHNVAIVNVSGTLNLVVDGSTFDDTRLSPAGADGFLVEARSTAVATVEVSNSTFEDNTTQGFQGQSSDNAALSVIFRTNQVRNNEEGIVLVAAGGGDLDFDVDGNTVHDHAGVSIFVGTTTTATSAANLNGWIRNNAVDDPTFAVDNAGVGPKLNHAMMVFPSGDAQSVVEVSGNTIVNKGIFSGLLVTSDNVGATPDLDVRVLDNDVTSLSTGATHVIVVEGRQNEILCTKIESNAVTTNGPGSELRLRERDGSNVTLEQGAASLVDPPATVLATNNPAASNVTVTGASAVVANGSCAAPASFAPLADVVAAPLLRPDLPDVPAFAVEAQAAPRVSADGPLALAPVATERRSVLLAGETITLPIGTLPAGKDVTVTWDVTVADPLPAGTNQIANQGTVTADGGLSVPTDDPDTPASADPTVTPVQVLADLSLAKGDTPDPVTAGTHLTYTLSFASAGPGNAADVAVSDELPPNTTFVSAAVTTGSGWTATTPTVGDPGTVTFEKASVADGETATFEIVVAVDANTPDGTILTNSAEVTSATSDPNTGDNTATSETTVEGVTDLSIAKADDPDPVVAGNDLTYTLSFSNAGPNTAEAVTVSDVVPAQTTFVSAAVTTGAGWSLSAPPAGGTGTVAFTKPSVTAGEVATFTVVVKVDSDAGGVVENTATVASDTPDPNAANDTVTINTAVNGEADLSVAKTDAPDPVVVGANLTYTITFANAGPSAAGDVAVTDVLPANTTFVSAAVTDGAGWTVDAPAAGDPGTVTFQKGAVADGETATFELVVKVDPGTPHDTVIENTATVESATADPNAANDSATTQTTVQGAADLAVTKVDTPDPVEEGGDVTYTITFTNAGPAPADVTVSDVVPAQTTFVSAAVTTGSGWSLVAPPAGGTGTVTFTRAAVAAGEEATFEVVVRADAGTAGATITNTVTATSPIPDPVADNNTATTETTVIPGLPHPYLLLADQDINSDGPEAAIGDLHANGKIDLKRGAPSIYQGNVTAVGDVVVDKDNMIDGDLTAGGDVELKGNATVTGTVAEQAAVAPVPLAPLSFTAGGPAVTVQQDQSHTLAPGAYGKVTVRQGGTLLLSNGSYYFQELKAERDATLTLDVTSGVIAVNVVDRVQLDPDTEVAIVPGGEAQSRWATFNSRGDIQIDRNARVLGTLHAPASKVRIDRETYFRGAIGAREIDLQRDVVLLHHDVPVGPALWPSREGNIATLDEEAPATIRLGVNYPNPFNPTTAIGFDLPEATTVRLTVYDVLGREVVRLVDGVVAAGRHQAHFEARDLPSGVYFYRMETPTFSEVRQMLLIK